MSSSTIVLESAFFSDDVSRFKELLSQSSHIGILPHTGADGDAMGSGFALKKVFNKLGISSEVVVPDEPADCALLLPEYSIASFKKRPDLLISVDTASRERCYLPNELASVPLINIDHHISNTLFGQLNLVHSQSVSACEVVTDLLVHCYGYDSNLFDLDVVETLLIGFITDSACLQIQGLGKRFFDYFSFLLGKGADFVKVRDAVIPKLSLAEFSLWQAAIQQAEVLCNDNLYFIYLDQNFLRQHHASDRSFHGLINVLSKQLAVDMICILIEVESGFYKGSFRSKKLSAQRVSAIFGGGGHVRAAGFRLINSNQNCLSIKETIINDVLAQIDVLKNILN